MSKKSTRSNQIGQTKRSTDNMIDDAIAQQNSWMERRRAFANKFLRRLNVFAKPAPEKKVVGRPAVRADAAHPVVSEPRHGILRAYWFPIVCAIVVIFIAVWVAFIRGSAPVHVVVPTTPEPVMRVVPAAVDVPTFDLVRVERGGTIIVAGRWLANKNISVIIDEKIVATMTTNARGEFVYAPMRPLDAGNYTLALAGNDPDIKSKDKVFLYVSPHGYENSVSLLMTADGSTLLQSPRLVDGDLAVSKIDYLAGGRIVVTGDALPRLRVSLTLNDRYLGFARVSDNHHFGLGADVGELKPGETYILDVRLHDGDGRTVATVSHRFVMPRATGRDDTFYTVRRGDCLWIIARNFMRRGVLFSIIAQKNKIENPDLIFPKQVLQIPVGEKNDH